MCVCYFCYRILDEMDGKQARKTGNASPLGMLMDHGLDAGSISFIILTLAKQVSLGDNLVTLGLVAGASLTFHLALLEQYYIGGVVLGKGNLITDGSFGLYAFYLFLGIAGN